MELTSYQNASHLYKSLGFIEKTEREFSILYLPDIHFEFPFYSPPFRSEYFSFIFIKEGSGTYKVDDKIFEVESNTIYFTNPGHLKSFQIESCDNAYLISFSEQFLREHVNLQLYEEFPFLLAEIVPPKQLSTEIYDSLERQIKNLQAEYHEFNTSQNRILGSLIKALLFKLKDLLWNTDDSIENEARPSLILQNFKRNLEQEFNKVLDPNKDFIQVQVQDYAAKQHLHPSYFNVLIKTQSGKSAGERIKERNLSMAKILLLNQSLSLKEIALKLGYSEAAHFSRFFKSNLNVSPSEFRKNSHLK